jgi:hypothetical protein
MYCQSIHPDGTRMTFEDILSPGQVVHTKDGVWVVGPDLGDEDPRLMPMDHEHYKAYWRAGNPHVAALTDFQPGGDDV